MEDEKKYKEALEKLQEALAPKDGREISGLTRSCIEEIFPELKESEDEKIKELLKHYLEVRRCQTKDNEEYINCNHFLAWLEKQQSVEEIVKRCKDSWYNEGKIKGMREGLTDDEKYQQGWHDALEKQGNKPQGKSAHEAIKEEKVDNANKYVSDFKASDYYVSKVDGKIHNIHYFNEPKFKVGNWYQCIKDFFGKGVTFDKNTAYYCAKEGCLQDEYGCHIAIDKNLYDNFKLWTIEDAKDGDVLASNVLISKYNKPFIYNGNHNSTHVGAYCGISTENMFNVATEKCRWTTNVNIRPATKEQRDLLFQKMKEAGYKWDAEKKEPKKIEQKPTKNIVEIWKDMRLEVYQQASGNKHEPNDSDDTTKMFSLNDIDEIIEKMSEQNPTDEEMVEAFRTEYEKGRADAIAEMQKEWSEEDEKNLKRAIWYVENPALNVVKDTMLSEWLKSIKERIKGYNNIKTKLIDIINKAVEWWLIHDSYSKDTNNLVNDFKKDLLKYVDISE